MSAESELSRAEFGSDYIVELMRALGIEYAGLQPRASFRGLHDSLVNFGDTASPGVVQRARAHLGGDRPGRRQGDRKADGGHPAQHGRVAARLDGDLQRLGRPGADSATGPHRAGR